MLGSLVPHRTFQSIALLIVRHPPVLIGHLPKLLFCFGRGGKCGLPLAGPLKLAVIVHAAK